MSWEGPGAFRFPRDDRALACQAHPDDCMNGPEPHEFVPDEAADASTWPLIWPCCRQPWEEVTGG